LFSIIDYLTHTVTQVRNTRILRCLR